MLTLNSQHCSNCSCCRRKRKRSEGEYVNGRDKLSRNGQEQDGGQGTSEGGEDEVGGEETIISRRW